MARGVRQSLKRSQPARVALLLVLTFPLWPEASFSAPPQELPKHIRRLNDSCLKAFERLAVKYDQEKDPEAAHFFASCALGFGSKDSKIASIKGGWEIDVYIGKARGGKALERTGPIQGDMRRLANEYKKVIDPYLEQLSNRSISNSDGDLLRDLLVRYELARGAASYIKAIQRFNELRRGMGLRAVLWDFGVSSQLILASWYMAETGDGRTGTKSDIESPYYSPSVETAKQQCALFPMHSLLELPDSVRTFARVRQQLLNIDCRTILLASWEGGKKLRRVSMYSFPTAPVRKDIPTPSQRYNDRTVVTSIEGWNDTERTVSVAGRLVPYSIYPYEGESDVPPYFSNGRGGHENGWARTEYVHLEKAGIPIMVRFFDNCRLTGLSTAVSTSAGEKLSMRLYTNQDDRIQLPSNLTTVLLLPEAHLPSGTKIIVTIKCSLDDSPFEKTWSFRTAR